MTHHLEQSPTVWACALPLCVCAEAACVLKIPHLNQRLVMRLLPVLALCVEVVHGLPQQVGFVRVRQAGTCVLDLLCVVTVQLLCAGRQLAQQSSHWHYKQAKLTHKAVQPGFGCGQAFRLSIAAGLQGHSMFQVGY